VTTNGNIVELAFKSVEQIRRGFFTEGYALCVGGAMTAYDYADQGDSGFQAATFTEPNGANTLPITVTRLTSDGSLKVVQTYSAGTDWVTVTTKVTNTTGARINAVQLMRVADIDTNSTFQNAWVRSSDAVIGYDENGTGTLMGTTSYNLPRTSGVVGVMPFSTCAPASDATPVTKDGVAFQSYNLSNIVAGTTKSTATSYRRF
jgi:hypothetical protein